MTVETALRAAKRAFDSPPRDVETGLEHVEDADLLLRKACRLLAALEDLGSINGYHTLAVEVSFACIERSIEFYLAGRNRDPPTTHAATFEMAADLGLLTAEQAEELVELWGSYRNENYYDDGKATRDRADAMRTLATTVHSQAVELTQGGAGVCCCG